MTTFSILNLLKGFLFIRLRPATWIGFMYEETLGLLLLLWMFRRHTTNHQIQKGDPESEH